MGLNIKRLTCDPLKPFVYKGSFFQYAILNEIMAWS